MRVWRVSLALTLFAAPTRQLPGFVRYLVRARRRGRAARIPRATPWEELLPLPIDEVRRRMAIPSAADAHPEGIWRSPEDEAVWAPG